jgi:hypothetical protein
MPGRDPRPGIVLSRPSHDAGIVLSLPSYGAGILLSRPLQDGARHTSV